MEKSFTLTEILVVVVVVGILAAIGLPNYSLIKEKALDKEAKATIALIRAAENIYRMDHGDWYPPLVVGPPPVGGGPRKGGPYAVNDPSYINAELKLNIPTSLSSWSYTVYQGGDIQARRYYGGHPMWLTNNRSWRVNAGAACENPTCTPIGAGTCFSVGGC